MLDLKRTFAVLLLAGWLSCGEAQGQTVSGLKVSAGFEVTQVAGDELASNIYCLAVSPKGETFVSGPGYIKRMLDTDGDGLFDAVSLFADGPRTGAQGISFDGNDLLCTGDGGLLRYVDANGDRVADGPPERIFPIKTGGEHHAHAIRKGPDGWWYVLAGNQTPILKEYYAGPDSPVVEPRAGFLMRISPDWKTKEIFAHGFRNAYDFDFNSLGEVFVYDSDGERDISLPWYRPTRLFLMRAGDDAGWVSAGWKRPSSFFDMPIEIGALGRGSPTGVVVSDSSQFPAGYDDAIFVADWTFGRVTVFRRTDRESDEALHRYDGGAEFVIADGQFGFAVTDLDFGPDGSLLVSVGGRGTQGGIYRVSYNGDRSDKESVASPDDEWVIRAKAKLFSVDELLEGLNQSSRRIQEAALEAMVGRRDIWGDRAALSLPQVFSFYGGLEKALEEGNSKTAGLVLRILEQGDASIDSSGDGPDSEFVGPINFLTVVLIPTLQGQERAKGRAVEQVIKKLAFMEDGQDDAAFGFRLVQLLLGGCGAPGADPMFGGYTARTPLPFSDERFEKIADHLAIFIKRADRRVPLRRDSESGIDEAGRLAAMLGCGSRSLQKAMADLLDREDATATQDIHWLNCISQTTHSDGFEERATKQIAKALTGLGGKIERDGLNLDRNFYPRMRSLVEKLFQMDDGELAAEVAKTMSGSEDQVYLVNALSGEERGVAITRMANWIGQNPDDVAAGQIQVLGRDSGGQHKSLIRPFADRPELLGVVIGALSRNPERLDHEIFLRGLGVMDATTVKNSAIAIRRIFAKPNSEEVVRGLLATTRFGWDKQSVSVRDQLILMLTKHSGDGFGYQPKQPDLNQSESMKRWLDWAKQKYPVEFAQRFRQTESASLESRLELIDWEAGEVSRGARVYKRLQCAQCHDAGTRLGPRLEGVAQRFGRDDLFRTIVVPSGQVAERYRAILIETVDGQFFKGSVVYESVDGITLQEPNGNAVRINQDAIESRVVSGKSLMPDRLLDDATDQDWADLYAYLKSR